MIAAAVVPELGWIELLVASALVLVAGGISLALQLGLGRRLALGAVRTVIQLLLIGYVLRWIFANDAAWAVFAIAMVMILGAGRAAVKRSSRRFRGLHARAFGTLFLTGFTTTIVVTAVVLRIDPFYDPRSFLPLLGMVLGNGLTGISLALDDLLTAVHEKKDEIEMELAMGATPGEACRGPLRNAVRRGMIPMINSMMVVGIVSLPGMMTGQILAGADPLQAVRYQIVVMFMLAAGTAFGCMIIAFWVRRHVFDDHGRLRGERVWRAR